MEKKDSVLDQVDKNILSLLRENGRLSMTKIGESVHLTSQAVKNRINRLMNLGVINYYTVNVNCPVYGYTVHALIRLSLQIRQRKAFESYIKNTPYFIEHCYQITGQHSYQMDGHFVNHEALDTCVQELETFGAVEVHIILKDILSQS